MNAKSVRGLSTTPGNLKRRARKHIRWRVANHLLGRYPGHKEDGREDGKKISVHRERNQSHKGQQQEEA